MTKKPKWRKSVSKYGVPMWEGTYDKLRLVVSKGMLTDIWYWEVGNRQYVTVKGWTKVAALSRAYAEAAAGYRKHDFKYWHNRQERV